MKRNIGKALGFILFVSAMSARLLFADGSVDRLKQFDFNRDGKLDNVSLIYSDPDDYGNCTATLRLESRGKAFTVFLKEGFNAETTYLKKLILSDKIKPFIVVEAKTNKSKTQRIYSFDGHRLKEELVVFSNFPLIEQKDTDKDGIVEILAKMKDDRPGRDPNKDSYERIYKWNGLIFYDSTDDRFKKEEIVPSPSPTPSGDEDEN